MPETVLGLGGRILLTDNTEIEITDSIVVANSVSIQMSTCREKSFDFGTFNAAVLSMGVVDENALGHDFGNAVVQLEVTELDGEGDEVTTLLGQYYVDPKSIERKRNTVKFKAYDAAMKFDVEIPSNVRNTSYTALTLIQAACTACGVNFESTIGIPTGSPNTAVTFNLSSAAVQTWRDAVMWACQLICANAIINRNDMLEIRTAWYEYNDPQAFTCTASDRADIEFSDSRTFLRYLNSYSGKDVKRYTSVLTTPSGALDAEMSLKKNPLLKDKSAADCDTINQALLSVPIVQRQIKAKMFDNATISLGDIGQYSGGKVDVRNSIRGKTTGITWRYRGYTTVISTAPEIVR